jgi:alpha-L-fucosidase
MRLFNFLILFLLLGSALSTVAQKKEEQKMNEMWGDQVAKLTAQTAGQGQLFRDGNYAMFIHWGLYSNLGNEWKGKTYYGIGEWIMNKNMANIPVEEYKATAKYFNPVNFDAKAIANLARDAGMKYIIITSKHHDGFAMYGSKVNKFNILDATPFARDPMKELAQACKEAGIGFGFYYSHNQDWTEPGGNGGPKTNSSGETVTFEDYFKNKCLPQVEEITREYGQIELVWFDTPGNMPKAYAQQLVDLVHKNQPHAYVSGRVGHNLGDYATLGDMEVPVQNEEGLWESVDVTNDSWGYAAYDQNWKSPKEILTRMISTVARGGTYMLNVGPKPDGTIPEQAAQSLRSAGEWIRRYPQVVYGTEASPWKHALPWGDVTAKDNKLFLAVYHWPANGHLYLPGLKTEILSAKLLGTKKSQKISFKKSGTWTDLTLPGQSPEKFIPVIEVTLKGKPEVDTTQGVDPSLETIIPADFAKVEDCSKNSRKWMEKFGEWKHIVQVNKWSENSKASWEVEVMNTGTYLIELNYSGNGRMVWQVETDEGSKIKNQQNSSPIYSVFPIGWLKFTKPGKHTLTVSMLEGDFDKANLTGIKISPVEL